MATTVACGGEQARGSDDDEDPKVVVGATDAVESLIVASFYAEELGDAGYQVERQYYLPATDLRLALQKGTVDVAPQFLGIGSGLGVDPGGTEARTQRALQAGLPDGLVALEPSEGGTTYSFVVTRQTAELGGVAEMSDLAGRDDLVLGGDADCPRRPACLPGLQRTYGVDLSTRFRALDPGGPRTKAALFDGSIDVALLSSTDAAIQEHGWVLLDDDRGLQPSGRVLAVVAEDVLDMADVRRALERASEALTASALRDIIWRTSVEQQDPEDAALYHMEKDKRGGP